MVCTKCQTEAVKNVALNKEFWYCRTCKAEVTEALRLGDNNEWVKAVAAEMDKGFASIKASIISGGQVAAPLHPQHQWQTFTTAFGGFVRRMCTICHSDENSIAGSHPCYGPPPTPSAFGQQAATQSGRVSGTTPNQSQASTHKAHSWAGSPKCCVNCGVDQFGVILGHETFECNPPPSTSLHKFSTASNGLVHCDLCLTRDVPVLKGTRSQTCTKIKMRFIDLP